MNKLRLSVVTPAYNASAYIEILLKSVAEQTYDNIEHIVIDDGSKDEGATIEVIKKYPKVQWWTRPNKGQYATLNEGVRKATGDFIVIICADDLFARNDMVERMMEQLNHHPDWNFICGDTEIVDENGTFKRFWPTAGGYWLPKALWKFCVYAPHCSLFASRKTLFENDLFFDESMKFASDRDWLIRLHKASRSFGYVPISVAQYREHSSSQTSTLNQDLKTRENKLVNVRHHLNFSVIRLVTFYLRWCQRLFAKTSR